ncbi:tetratricopeptide repeat protein [Methylomicrobium agile]|uniref:tetratricopeptide repeat protein n=1 Tax=Methylomicrobium agile TaxID=39774 RepID=UPI0012F681F8|nr:tetratricopeptide repeat protein [Methylomicrobium agile]
MPMVKFAMNGILPVLTGVLLMGCSQLAARMDYSASDETDTRRQKDPACETGADPDQNVKLDLIRKLMDSGKLYAALAHLEETRSTSPQSIYLRAEILRQTNREEKAAELYRSLLDGCMAGKGHHGLGLIAGKENKASEAVYYLQKAEAELPTDARVRNDLGYALMLDGQLDPARDEFLTALELKGNDPLAAANMVLLLAIMGKEQEMQAFASYMNIDPETVTQLRKQAEKIKASAENSDKQSTAAPP